MAAVRYSSRLFRATNSASPVKAFQPRALATPRFYSSTTDDAPPPFLATLKDELKKAMRAKDAPRLSVLRSIMSHNLNASKTKQPIRTNVELVHAIAKMRKSAEESAQEAKSVGRDDLVEKSLEEARLLEDYEKASGVQIVEEEELISLVKQEIETLAKESPDKKVAIRDVIQRVKTAAEGKIVDNKSLANHAKNLIQ